MVESDPPVERVHGSLVEVRGVGILLLGRSGIGKSEAALELVMRGHRLVADDVVLIAPDEDGAPVGRSHELVRHYLEIRGIGIISVPSLFGEVAVLDRTKIDLVIQLTPWGKGEVERVGLEQGTRRVAGFEIAALTLPVAPGRNIASLVEVAGRNHALRRAGRSGAAELEARVTELLRRESS